VASGGPREEGAIGSHRVGRNRSGWKVSKGLANFRGILEWGNGLLMGIGWGGMTKTAAYGNGQERKSAPVRELKGET